MGANHYLNRTISSTDLSGQQKLSFDVAADRPGTYLALTAGNNAFANYQPDTNTVGLWHLDEQTGSGNFIKDASVNGNNLASNGSPSSVQGKIGKARSFSTTSTYLSCTDLNCGGTTNLDIGTRSWKPGCVD